MKNTWYMIWSSIHIKNSSLLEILVSRRSCCMQHRRTSFPCILMHILPWQRSSFGREFRKTYFSIWRDAEPGWWWRGCHSHLPTHWEWWSIINWAISAQVFEYMMDNVQFYLMFCTSCLFMSRILYQGGLFLPAYFIVMYLKPFLALRLAISLVVCGGSHMILGVHHWHPIVLSCLYFVKWLWQHTSGWKSTCFYLIWCRKGMHCTSSLCGTLIHFLVFMWQLISIGFCFHVLLVSLCSWEALKGEWAWGWRCALRAWFSLLYMLHTSGGTMGRPWMPHYIYFLLVGGTTWRTWGGTPWIMRKWRS